MSKLPSYLFGGEGMGRMASATQQLFAAALWGAGLALFALYVLTHAVVITLEGWPRIALGVVGLSLGLAGFVWRTQLSKSAKRSNVDQATIPDKGRS